MPTFAVIFCGNSQQPIMLFVLFHFLTFTSPILPSLPSSLGKRFQKQRRMSFCTSNKKGFLYPSNNLHLLFFLSLSLSLTMFAILYTPYLYFHKQQTLLPLLWLPGALARVNNQQPPPVYQMDGE